MNFRGFAVGECIYDGHGSEVYRARRESDGLAVVLKIFKPAYPSPERLIAIRREYEIARSLDTAAIASHLALEVDQHRYALVVEDFNATSLDLLRKARSFSIEEILRIAIAAVGALSEIHSRSVIHLEIKPANLIWNEAQNRLAFIDFGAAIRTSRASPHLSSDNVLEGTLAYISPEQTGRMNRDIDRRSDFYSFGVTLYELLTQELPFSTNDSAELTHAHIAVQPMPPRIHRPDLPEALSNIVMKLMAKSAEDRYQSAYGLQADLNKCLQQILEGNRSISFELGSQDKPEWLEIPRKLYGRERERKTLLGALERLTQQTLENVAYGVQAILVSGGSGIGKSALVEELREPIAKLGGFYVAGKFDQLQRMGPFAAPIAALRSLVRQLLSLPPRRLASFREQILEALGPNGRVLIDVLPEIEFIIGPQPAVEELGPLETQNRFQLVFRSFVRVLARKSHPLCVFLDDLQWADSASLNWIHQLLDDDKIESLLLIGAYRDQEVDAGHPFFLTLRSLRQKATAIEELYLEPLGIDEISALVADFVGADQAHARPLAELVLRKTAGNPLFASELLKVIHEDGLIWLDRQQGSWLWDIAAIEERGITNNIVELVLSKLRRLPEGTQRVLQIAACMGNTFDLDTLSIIEAASSSVAAGHLAPAVNEGFLVVNKAARTKSGSAPEANESVQYKFVHDRIQQAAYALIDDGQRKELHLRIGRLLLAGTPEEGRADRIFDLLDQMNPGRDLISDAHELIELVKLNLEAGKKATAAIAYGAARNYLGVAADVLGPGGFDEQYELAMAVYRALATADSLDGEGALAEQRMRLLLAKAKTPIEQAESCNMLIHQLTLLARYPEAVDTARDGLNRVGVTMPTENIGAAFIAELEAAEMILGDRDIATLLDHPPMTDPRARVAAKILESVMSAALYTDPVLWFFCVMKGNRLCLEHGTPPESAALYAYYGQIVNITYGQAERAYAFAKLSLRLADRFNSAFARCLCGFVMANFIMPWVRPLGRALPINLATFQAGIESGEQRWSGYSLVYRLMNHFIHGQPIAQALADVPGFIAINQKSKNQIAIDVISDLRLMFVALSSPGESSVGEQGGTLFDPNAETELLEAFQANGSVMATGFHHIFKTQLLYLFGAPAEALRAADAAFQLAPALAGHFAVTPLTLYAALSVAALHTDKPETERDASWARLQGYEAKIAEWAKLCPATYLPMKLLVNAEMARISGEPYRAIALFDEAREAAHNGGFMHLVALANELAAKVWLKLDRQSIAEILLTDAVVAYEYWGATRKVAALKDQYPQVFGRDTLRGSSTNPSRPNELDLASVIKASQAISSEIVLEKLLLKLIVILVENAGAENGALLLVHGDQLFVEVEAQVDTTRRSERLSPRIVQSALKEDHPHVVTAIVQYVVRTKEDVILVDAVKEGAFTHVPRVQQRRPRSILCTPLLSQGKLLGVLYFENNLTAGAFTPRRLQGVRLLSSQTAISIENARHYADMEQLVAERTADLRKNNADLEAALGRLKSAQQKLIQAEKMASLGMLAGGISHEIKNPLNFINNFAATSVEIATDLEESIRSSPDIRGASLVQDIAELRMNSEKICQYGNRADGIVQSMMEHVNRPSAVAEKADVNRLMGRYLAVFQQSIRSRNPEFEVVVQGDFDPKAGAALMSGSDIGRVLMNLLNNAFYALRSSRTPSPIITVRTVRRGSEVRIEVKDNGPGVQPAHRDRIFEPFFTTKPPGEGTGLGLSLSYDIVVRGHDGTLTLETVEGNGALFVVTLPSVG